MEKKHSLITKLIVRANQHQSIKCDETFITEKDLRFRSITLGLFYKQMPQQYKLGNVTHKCNYVSLYMCRHIKCKLLYCIHVYIESKRREIIVCKLYAILLAQMNLSIQNLKNILRSISPKSRSFDYKCALFCANMCHVLIHFECKNQSLSMKKW